MERPVEKELEREAALKKLRTKEHYKVLFDLEPDAIFIADPETGMILDANQAAVELSKYPKEKLLEMHHSLLHPKDERDTIDEEFKKSMNVPVEGTLLDAEEKIIPVEIIGKMVKTGEKMIALGIFRDITLRRELEEQKNETFKKLENINADLRLHKNLTDSVIDSLPGIFYQIDTKGNYKRWNRRFLEVTGFNDKEMEKIKAVEFFRGDDVKNVADAMETVFTQGETKVEADLYLKSGESIPYLFTGIKFDLEGEPFILGMGLDISEMRTAQINLKKTVLELETFNKMAVGREKRMIELKAKINRLSKELGRNEPYNLSFADREN